jgi:hypothetical protein
MKNMSKLKTMWKQYHDFVWEQETKWKQCSIFVIKSENN